MDLWDIHLTNLLWPQLEIVHLNNIWFQWVGDLCHTAIANTELFRKKVFRFGYFKKLRHWIAFKELWFNTTILYYFLGGYLRSLIFSNKQDSLQAWKVSMQWKLFLKNPWIPRRMKSSVSWESIFTCGLIDIRAFDHLILLWFQTNYGLRILESSRQTSPILTLQKYSISTHW